MYWDETRNTDDIVKEYIEYEFSSEPDLAETIFCAVKKMQSTYIRRIEDHHGDWVKWDKAEGWG